MRLLVSLLLIPLFVLGQVLPHSHAGTGISVPHDHASRPHIHLHGHDHHHDHGHHDEHGDDEKEESGNDSDDLLTESSDHDSDAVYLPESDWTVSRKVPHQMDLSFVVLAYEDCHKPFVVEGRLQAAFHPPDRESTLPVYLLTASLRL